MKRNRQYNATAYRLNGQKTTEILEKLPVGCRTKEQIAKERGAFLTEHRRCVDPIIAYCNDYVYHGRLLPMKGNKVKYKALPPKGYVHVNGVSEKGTTGSVLNKAEASAIVSWLEKEKEKLESVYKDPIHKIVAIVTPERNTPVGNLAKWLFDDPANEISGHFIYQQEEPLCRYQPAERLSTLEAHTGLLREEADAGRKALVENGAKLVLLKGIRETAFSRSNETYFKLDEGIRRHRTRICFLQAHSCIRSETTSGRK